MSLRKKILIVDIDEGALVELQRILENAGFDTTITWDSSEAREILRHQEFELLMVCDHPPEVVAKELFAHITSCRGLPRCVVLKSVAAEPSAERMANGTLVICKRNYEEVLRTIRAQLQDVRLALAS